MPGSQCYKHYSEANKIISLKISHYRKTEADKAMPILQSGRSENGEREWAETLSLPSVSSIIEPFPFLQGGLSGRMWRKNADMFFL